MFGLLLSLIFFRLPFINRYGNYLVSTWHNTKGMSKLDQILYPAVIYSWITHVYLHEPNPDKREALKSIAMGGESGRNWAEHYQTKNKISGSGGMIDLNGKVGNNTSCYL